MIYRIIILIIAVSSLVLGNGNSYAYDPMLYEDGWKQLSKDEINKRMREPVININTNKPFNFKVINNKEEEVGRVNTPNEYYQQIILQADNELDIYTTYDIISEGLFRRVAIPLFYLSEAKSSKYSYVRYFPFNKDDPLTVFPAGFVRYVGSDQRKVKDKAVQENRSWRYIAPNSRILEKKSDSLRVYSTFDEDMYNLPKEERYNGELPSHCINPVVLGDLNNDGYEDIVLHCAHYLVGGTGRSYYFVVLTRKSQNSVLEDITDQANKLFWEE